jgi:hypothetical protein
MGISNCRFKLILISCILIILIYLSYILIADYLNKESNGLTLPDMEIKYSYVDIYTGRTISFKKNVSGYTQLDLVNDWIIELYNRGVDYGRTENGENILFTLRANQISKDKEIIVVDFNDSFLHFDVMGTQPGRFMGGLRDLISQVTDAEKLSITIDKDDSRIIIHPDGFSIIEQRLR